MTRRLFSFAFVLCLSVACGKTVPRTQVMLEVDAEPAIRARADGVRITVNDPDGYDNTFRFSDPGVTWPVRVALVPQDNDATRRFAASAFALDGATHFAVVRARSGYVAEQTLVLRLVLFDACADVMCGEDETCDELGGCDDTPDIDPHTLAPLDGGATDAGRLDGGSLDGGGADGGTPDGGRPTTGWAYVDCGEHYTCAVRAEDERVFCWGLNSAGQCTGKDDPSGARDTGVIAPSVTGGGRTTCALPDTSATTCWGGEFPGDGTSFQPRMAVVVDRTLETISSGSTHVCGIEAGVVYCWGENNLGQLGAPGANNPLPTAVTDPLLEEATAVAAGDSFTCVLDRDRAGVVCFGANDGGQVSPSEASMTLGPTDVGLMVPSGLTSLAAGVRHACAADASFVVCWGDNTGLAVDPGGPVGPTLPSTLSFPAGSVRQVVAGNQLSCALLDDGDIQCWGSNSNGQRGDGGSGLATPTRVSLDRAAVQISAGHQHACAITAEGELYCWGRNDSGQLGDGSSEDSDRPVLVPVPAL